MIDRASGIGMNPGCTGVRSGLTLMEVMVVLGIVALGWFTLLPNLNLIDSEDQASTELESLNRLLVDARFHALKTGEIQAFNVTKGNDVVEWNEETVSLPSYLAFCTVNGERPPGRKASFRIYPSGFMDEVELVLSMGDTWAGDILNVSFAEKGE